MDLILSVHKHHEQRKNAWIPGLCQSHCIVRPTRNTKAAQMLCVDFSWKMKGFHLKRGKYQGKSEKFSLWKVAFPLSIESGLIGWKVTVSSLVPIHYVSDLRSIQSIISQRYGLWTNPGHAAKISTQPFFSRISSAHGMACLVLTLEALKGFIKEATERVFTIRVQQWCSFGALGIQVQLLQFRFVFSLYF